jgi:hypothetical protein
MKMRFNFVFVCLLFALFFVSFVSAQYYSSGFFYGTEQVIESLVQNLEPILRALFGGQDWTGYLLFEKTLLFILVTIIIGLVLQNLPVFKDRPHKGILRLVAVIIGILAIRGISFTWLNTILVQYQVLFIAVAGILPFMIYWYFVKEFDDFVRKTAWVFYAIIYLGLWITTDLEAYAGVYLWGAIVALVYAFFLDVPVRRWLKKQEMKMWEHQRKWERIDSIDKRIKQIEESSRPENEKSKIIKALDKERTELIRNLPFS